MITDVQDEFPHETQFQPLSTVHPDYHWLTALISNTISSMSDYPDFQPDDRILLYLAFERSFDCNEKDCVIHSSWSLHIKRLDDSEDNIGESIDLTCLHHHVEDWLTSFLSIRFPSLSFDYDSLLRNDSVPSLNLH